MPLNDCTNKFCTVRVQQEEAQKINSRGQWKRRARQCGMKLADRDGKHHDANVKENLK